MKFSITETKDVDAKYLQVDAGVRYWEDGSVNGIEDDNDNPSIPFVSKGRWMPLIHLESGRISQWPSGVTADVHYKVCDDGVYTLTDEFANPLKVLDGYVPRIMSPKEHGYGDYIIMEINGDGYIQNWVPVLTEFEDQRD